MCVFFCFRSIARTANNGMVCVASVLNHINIDGVVDRDRFSLLTCPFQLFGWWCSAAGEVSNGSLLSGSWLRSPAVWLPRTGISSGTLRSFRVWVYLYLYSLAQKMAFAEQEELQLQWFVSVQDEQRNLEINGKNARTFIRAHTYSPICSIREAKDRCNLSCWLDVVRGELSRLWCVPVFS